MNKKQKKAIEKWLKDEGGEDLCPFIDFNYKEGGMSRCEDNCDKWFPKVKAQLEDKKATGCLLCPCQSYSVKYVRKVAKTLIKEK